MMKINISYKPSFVFIICALSYMISAEGLICWTCENQPSNRACRLNGRMQRCQSIEEACQNEVRRGSQGMRVTKRCKQASACDNNFVQNPRAAWVPSQCNSGTPSSVCRCCCAEDLCNRRSLNCLERCNLIRAPAFGTIACDGPIRQTGVTCSFSCNRGFRLVGDDSSTCRFNDQGREPRYDRPPPICEPEVCLPIQIAPTNGNVSCNNDNNLGSVCTFTCNEGIALVGSPATTCTPTDSEPTWDNEPPTCELIQCFPAQTDPANGTVTCTNENNLSSDCTFTCDFGFFLDGSSLTTCLDDFNGDPEGIWSEPAPVCVQIICQPVQTNPENGRVLCYNDNNLGSVCRFSCESGFVLDGVDEIACVDLDDNGAFGEWTDPPPTCRTQVCGNPPAAPENGNIDCDGITVGSQCEFVCDPHYTRVGSLTTTCIRSDFGLTWNHPAPICEPIVCPEQRLPGGEVTCDTADRIATTNCSFRCIADGFELYPPEVTDNTCLDDKTWNVSRPCCTRPCPPFALMDLVIIMDSSSSIGNENWLIMKRFVKNIFESFALGPNAARFAVFRYNHEVDTRSQILFSDYPSDIEAFLNAFEQIPYSKGGTLTGQALEHARDVIFTEEKGDRPHVKDVMLIITDGKSQGNVTNVSIDLREHGVSTYAFGIGSSLDKGQLLDIAGSPENRIIAEEGFEGLNIFSQLVRTQICGNPCDVEPPVDEN